MCRSVCGCVASRTDRADCPAAVPASRAGSLVADSPAGSSKTSTARWSTLRRDEANIRRTYRVPRPSRSVDCNNPASSIRFQSVGALTVRLVPELDPNCWTAWKAAAGSKYSPDSSSQPTHLPCGRHSCRVDSPLPVIRSRHPQASG